ncbi:TRAP transporter substrate-binding protein [Mollicutes bacterium LVI A0039]|nr:TRAP transporter substrate-binding protein [Mollicutes bacterium LVI A0039]
MKNILTVIGLLSVLVLVLTGCSTSAAAGEEQLTLRMAHGIADSSDSGQAIAQIEELVEEESNNSIDMQIYGSGVLGSERDTIEMVQAGVLDMAKVGASSLDAFDSAYGVFSLPFMFENEEDLYSAMTNTDLIEQLNKETVDDGFIFVGWYPSGARNFYTAKDTPIQSPDDLKGMKIRVMESAVSKEMVSLLGASPVPMASSETYTALQQGVIDGAENNELALTVNRHMDVAKSYSYTRHQMVPDIYILSTKTLENMTDEQVLALQKSLWENNLYYRELNNEMLTAAKQESEEAGVEFYELDVEPFREKVMPMHESYMAKSDANRSIYNTVADAAGKEGSYDAPTSK